MRTLVVVFVLFAAMPAHAGDDRVPPVTDPLVLKECGNCHMAFQPAFLPARSWNRLMAGLADHFGEDASLPADQSEAIRTYLTANAGDVRPTRLAAKYMNWVRPGAAPLRITENPAFEREHRLAAQVWQAPKVVTKSNCPACHRAADRGVYEDD